MHGMRQGKAWVGFAENLVFYAYVKFSLRKGRREREYFFIWVLALGEKLPSRQFLCPKAHCHTWHSHIALLDISVTEFQDLIPHSTHP